MKRLLLGCAALGLLATAVAFSSGQKLVVGDLEIQREERNPWTNLRLNNAPEDFQFALVSDRTGGHRAKVFSQAVEQLNLLQPQFVISVGDLIEGYKEDQAKLAAEWREFQGYVSKLQMPFFYVAGNHDLSTAHLETSWKEKFGRRYYHFVYRNTLFLLLNSDDPFGKSAIGEEQQKYIKQTLDENKNARWTIVVLHRPMWAEAEVEKTGWLDVEKLLGERPYTVFAGHFHRYQKYVRNGRNYYQLATTGGVSRMRGVRYSEFDHLTWVTMKKDGPVLANILLDGIYNESMKQPLSNEEGVSVASRKPVYPVKGKVYFEGSPAPDASLTFYAVNPVDQRKTKVADALVEADGTFTPSTYTAFDGLPEGKYAVSIMWWKPLWTDAGTHGPNLLPDKYGSKTALTVEVKKQGNDFTFNLEK